MTQSDCEERSKPAPAKAGEAISIPRLPRSDRSERGNGKNVFFSSKSHIFTKLI
jgi:hypothetical protein